MARARAGTARARDKVTAAGMSIAVAALASILSPEVRHWFVIPVAVSGALIGWEAVAWARGARRFFDCDVAVSFIGVHCFLVAPLLHVSLDQYMGYVLPPPDWRPWLGRMAAFNVAGILAYRVVRELGARSRGKGFGSAPWHMDSSRLGPLAAILAASVALQVWIYARFGGLAGYVSTFEAGPGGFAGWGWVFAVSESAPVLMVIAVASGVGLRYLRSGWATIGTFVLVMFCVKVLFGGLRGSRGEVVWFMFWCLAVIDYRVRPISRAFLVVTGTCGLLFMYGYGFYKSAGLAGLRALTDTGERKALEASTNRTFAGVLLGDLGRADVQAYLLYKYYEYPEHYSPAMGTTYLAAMLAHVPAALELPRPGGKVKVGTELQYGPASYNPDGFRSTVIYGLAGETLLNFGPLWIPAAYLVFGLIVGGMRRFETAVTVCDARVVLLPLLTYVAVLMLTADLDNVIYVTTKVVLVPFAAVFLCSRRPALQVWRGNVLTRPI